MEWCVTSGEMSFSPRCRRSKEASSYFPCGKNFDLISEAVGGYNRGDFLVEANEGVLLPGGSGANSPMKDEIDENDITAADWLDVTRVMMDR